MILALAPTKKSKATKASGKGKKKQEEPKTSEVLPKTHQLVGIVSCMSNTEKAD